MVLDFLNPDLTAPPLVTKPYCSELLQQFPEYECLPRKVPAEPLRPTDADWVFSGFSPEVRHLDRAVKQEAHSFGKDGWVPRVGGQLSKG